MGARVFWLTLIRILLAIFSMATLACHISQIVLLRNNNWFPRNYSYILYFVGPGVSTISSLALLFTMICGIKSIRGDRLMGVLNLALMIATVVLVTLKSGPVPWEIGDAADTDGPKTGFQPGCSDVRGDLVLYQRCWLSNGMWIGSVVIAALWLLLVLYVFVQRSGDIFQNDSEYEIYDFKTAVGGGHDSIPMAVTSPSPQLQQQQQQKQQLQDQASDRMNQHGYQPQQKQQVYYDPITGGYSDHPPPSPYGYPQQSNYSQYDAYGNGKSDGYNNNNGGYGYYVPTADSAHTTPLEHTNSSHYTNNTPNGSHMDDDTTYIMSDIGGVDHRPPPTSPPHTPSKSHQVPHAYD